VKTGRVRAATELKRLALYVDDPRVASDARRDFRERVAWWHMALGRRLNYADCLQSY